MNGDAQIMAARSRYIASALDIHRSYPLPTDMSHDAAALQSNNSCWDPYIDPYLADSVRETTGFDSSYTLDTSAADPSGFVGWPVGLQGYQQHQKSALVYGDDGNHDGLRQFPGPIDPDLIDPGYMAQPRDGTDTEPYGNPQLLPDQQYHYQHEVHSAASPSSFESRPVDIPGTTMLEQLVQLDEALHGQAAAHLRAMSHSRLEPMSGTKRADTSVESAEHENTTKRRGKGRQRQQQFFSVDWAPPTPITVNTHHRTISWAKSASSPSRSSSYGRVLSVADDTGSSRRGSVDSSRPLSLFATNDDDVGGRSATRYHMSPVQTIAGLAFSDSTTAPSTVLPTPTSRSTPRPADSSSILIPASKGDRRPSTTITTSPYSTNAPSHKGRSNKTTIKQPPETTISPPYTPRRPTSSGTKAAKAAAADQRARNRAAATKCRVKSRAAETILEAEHAAAAERNRELEATARSLKEETLELRTQLLMHADCGCELIQLWAKNRARELAAQAIGGLTRGDKAEAGV